MARHILLKNEKQRIIQLNAGLKYNRLDDNYKRVHKDTFGTFIAIRPHNHKSYFIFYVENR
jgi:hypothetical protein